MSSVDQGYLSQPDLFLNQVVFVTDDDIWSVSLKGGRAERLTQTDYFCREPKLSKDGQKMIFLSNESGQWDIYLMSSLGGVQKRLTFKGGNFRNLHWVSESKIAFSSDFESAHRGEYFLYEYDMEKESLEKVPLGVAHVCLHYNEYVLLGRNLGDPARWKSYRGGTAGKFWMKKGAEKFAPFLKSLKSNLSNPFFYNSRLYFISDHKGIGQIYSVNLKGEDLRVHTSQKEYYVRNFNIFRGKVVYQCGGDLFLLDLKSNRSQKIQIQTRSPFKQAQERFEKVLPSINHYDLSKDASQTLLNYRGQIGCVTPWSEIHKSFGHRDTRYKLPTWTSKNTFVAISLNESKEESLSFFHVETGEEKNLFEGSEWGKVNALLANPKNENILVLTNQKCELWILDIKSQKKTLVEKNPYFLVSNMTWSPDGQYLVYSAKISAYKQGLRCYQWPQKKLRTLLTPVMVDSQPSFDPSGKYLFFVGQREFHPLLNFAPFEATVPLQEKIYVLNLSSKTPLLSQEYLDFNRGHEEEDKKEEKSSKKDKSIKVCIDFEGIHQRVQSLNLELALYSDLLVVEDKLFYLKEKNKFEDPSESALDNESTAKELYTYSFCNHQEELFESGVYGFSSSEDGKWILMDTESGFRLVSTESKPSDGSKKDKKDGWVAWDQFVFQFDPKWEWHQMYQEAWVLQKENFWNENMNSVDWENIYFKYYPLLDKVHTRSEFSDLIWEMQAELKTSHAYEYGGDYYRFSLNNKVGKLAAQLSFHQKKKCFHIDKIFSGESWTEESDSPLNQPGVSLSEGDEIYSIDSYEFHSPLDLERCLVNKGGKNIELGYKKKGQGEFQYCYVKALKTDKKVIYRNWVNQTKEYVHKKSNSRLGYIHIPDMFIQGYSEFHRGYFTELDYDGLIIDVRYNGGGCFSQVILKHLMQKLIGFGKGRWYQPEPYPLSAVKGPMVCITNELAGSDGDIFSHTFKLLELGTLIGKRTWGGVVGIWPRFDLIDGGQVTQPEFSSWYKDVGYQIENYGTDPHIEVDITPEDWAQGRDTQLEKAIDVALEKLNLKPPMVMK